MGKQFSLTTSDQNKLGAYRADPKGTPKGGMVVVQEIFGVNHHVLAVCDRLADLGYAAVAPAVFDRFVRDFECGYTPDDRARIAQNRTKLSVGSPKTVMAKLKPLIEETQAQAVMVTTMIYDHAARKHSYELLAGAFALAKK